MAFKITNKNEKKPTGKKFELIQHKNGQIGIILSNYSADNENNTKVAIFDETCKTSYGNWRLQDCILFNGEITLKN